MKRTRVRIYFTLLVLSVGGALLSGCSALPAASTPSVPPSSTASATAMAVPQVGTAIVVTPGTAEPAATATSAPGVARTITFADNGKTIELVVGERFLLALPEGWEWTVTSDDPAVVDRLAGAPASAGTQGLFEAKRAGRATLSATGELPCHKQRPPCLAPTRAFEVELVVR